MILDAARQKCGNDSTPLSIEDLYRNFPSKTLFINTKTDWRKKIINTFSSSTATIELKYVCIYVVILSVNLSVKYRLMIILLLLINVRSSSI